MLGAGGDMTTGTRRGGEDQSRRLTLRQGGNDDSRKLTLRPGGANDEVDESMEQLGGFCWGPPVDAFDHVEDTVEPDDVTEDVGGLMANTPFRLKVPATPFANNKQTPFRQPLFGLPSATPMRQPAATPFRKALATPFQHRQPAATPFRQSTSLYPNAGAGAHRGVSATPFRTPFRQNVAGPDQTYRSSAAHMFKTPVRPGALSYGNPYSTSNAAPGTGTGTARRTRAVTETEALRQVLESARKRVYFGGEDSKISQLQSISDASKSGRSLYTQGQDETQLPSAEETQDDDDPSKLSRPSLHPIVIPMFDNSMTSSEGLGGPPSPSPSPRPGSALSRRSATPSAMMTFAAVTPSAMYSRSGSRLSVRATTPTWTGRSARRDESEEDLSEDKERRERAERHRRAILEKEREKARKEELARLERQREKGKGREQDNTQEEVKGREELSSIKAPIPPSRLKEKGDEGPQIQEANPPRNDGLEASDRTYLERQAQSKLELERRRLERQKEARRRTESLQRDQAVEAARQHELALAEEMARQDEAKRRTHVNSSDGLRPVPAIRVDQASERKATGQKTSAGAGLAPALEPAGRRRVKSVDETLGYSTAARDLPDTDQGRESQPSSSQAPSPRVRTRSHEPLRPTAIEVDRPRPRSRVTIDDVYGRQQSLVQDVDALQKRIQDALRMLQSHQN